MEGVEYQLNNTTFRVYSEYYKKQQSDYIKLSKSKRFKSKAIVGGFATDKVYSVVVKNGVVLDKRAKVTLTRYEKGRGYKAGTTFRAFDVDGLKVLSVICYEICFPNIWQEVKGKVDLITHQISYPMFSEAQEKRWVSLQRKISSWFDAPLVCAVGRGKGIDISGVIINEKLENKNRWNDWASAKVV